MPYYWRFSTQLRSEASDELGGSRRVIKTPSGPTYLYAVSSMLLYYLGNSDLEAVITRANVHSKSTAAAVRICPRQTGFCACDPCWSASVSADPRSIGRCKKERFRARFRSVTIVAVGASLRSTVGMADPARYREGDDARDCRDAVDKVALGRTD